MAADPVYKFALGWDQEASLAALSSDYGPRVLKVEPGRLNPAGDGLTYPDGWWKSALEFSAMPQVGFQSHLTMFGFTADSIESVKITLQLPGRDRVDTIFNAVIFRPTQEFDTGLIVPVFELRLRDERTVP